MMTVFGLSVFLFIFLGTLWRGACRWRSLAKAYAGVPGRPIETRRFQSVVLLGLGAYNTLNGIVTISVHHQGVSMRMLGPFALFHAPLFIPYRDIRGWGTSWYLNAPSTELQFKNAEHIKVVMPTEQAKWIGSFSGQVMTVRDAPPPEGNAGRGWHAFALVSVGITFGMTAWLSYYYLSAHLL